MTYMQWVSDTLRNWLLGGAAFMALLWLTLFTLLATFVTVCVLIWTAKGPWDPSRIQAVQKAEQNADTARLLRVYDALRN
jgi:hypothetical protein